ncbi:MAG: LLM class flavin-dependent oxidoreductase [Symploca sp. SIO2D2]|nr:LLM class flavin-dependent oxidoreductase [Symploca sp. SIO2D2]
MSFENNQSPDVWQVAQLILQNSKNIVPLVGVQPVYMHPFSVAQKVATLGLIYGRLVDLNMIAGADRRELAMLGDRLSHDDRYVRLSEYIQIVRGVRWWAFD